MTILDRMFDLETSDRRKRIINRLTVVIPHHLVNTITIHNSIITITNHNIIIIRGMIMTGEITKMEIKVILVLTTTEAEAAVMTATGTVRATIVVVAAVVVAQEMVGIIETTLLVVPTPFPAIVKTMKVRQNGG